MNITPEQIKTAICSEFEITTEQLHSKSQLKRHAVPRHMFFYLAGKIYPHYSLNDLGELLLPKRHHSTIIHSRQIAEDEIMLGYTKRNYLNIIHAIGLDEPETN